MENTFNLIDEPWIPVADAGLVSLRQVFENKSYKGLGGSPVQKIAVFKLLLAIAQAAITPKNEAAWKDLEGDVLANTCLSYLDKWHDRFYLYGDKPFLQMPAISKARALPLGAFIPQISTGNTTVLNHAQVERNYTDAEKALTLLTLMGFALSGKKTDNSVVLSKGYKGKTKDNGKATSGKAGPSVGHMGFLHNFIMAENIHASLWINLFTESALEQANLYAQGIGTAPWEKMPEGEGCTVARNLKQTLMGRLIPLCRFCLFDEEGLLHYSEGIAHAGYKEGVIDPSMAVNYSGKDPRALWTDPEKRPWREITSLLALFEQTSSQGFQSPQLNLGLERARDVTEVFSLWSGGLRVSSNAGEQYVSGSDDAVESVFELYSSELGESWYSQLKQEMESLEALAKTLYGKIAAFYKEQLTDGAKIAAQGTQLFWQLCERDFQALLNHCEQDEESIVQRKKLRKKFAAYQHQAFDHFCPNATARQLNYWAKHRPNNYKYLAQGA